MNDLRLMLIAAQASHIASNAAHTSGPHHGYATKSACGTEAEVMQQQQTMHTGASSTRQLHSSLVQVRERERERSVLGRVTLKGGPRLHIRQSFHAFSMWEWRRASTTACQRAVTALYPDALHPHANAIYTILTDIAFIVGRKPGSSERGAR